MFCNSFQFQVPLVWKSSLFLGCCWSSIKMRSLHFLPGKLAEGLNIFKIKRCNPTFLSNFSEEIHAKAGRVCLQARLSGWKKDWSNVFWWQHTSSGRKWLHFHVFPCSSLSLKMLLFDKSTSFLPWTQEDHGSHEFPSDSLIYDMYRCLRKQLLWPSYVLDLIVTEEII